MAPLSAASKGTIVVAMPEAVAEPEGLDALALGRWRLVSAIGKGRTAGAVSLRSSGGNLGGPDIQGLQFSNAAPICIWKRN